MYLSPAFLRARSSESTTQPVVCAAEPVVLQSAAASPREKCVRRSSALTITRRRRRTTTNRMGGDGRRNFWFVQQQRQVRWEGKGLGRNVQSCAGRGSEVEPQPKAGLVGTVPHLVAESRRASVLRTRRALGAASRTSLTLPDDLGAGAFCLGVHDGWRGVIERSRVVSLKRASGVAKREVGAPQVAAHLGGLGGCDGTRRRCEDGEKEGKPGALWGLGGLRRAERGGEEAPRSHSQTKASP